MGTRFRQIVIALAGLLLIPAAARAQASIAGIVKDSSGAILPGVTVEASSPALIEKTRAVVTDSSGQYRIVDLRPGTYSITYSLAGFSTSKRDGIELTGSFVATIDAELRVGAVEETITVSGEAPIVDVQNPTKERVMNHDVLDSIPTGRTATTVGVLIPGAVAQTTAGVVTQDIGGNSGNFVLGLSIHGGSQLDQVYLQGGNLTTAMASTGYVSRIQVNFAATEEVIMDTGAAGAELASGGVRINILPKEGGNTFHGTVFGSYGNDKLQANNFTADLQARKLTTPDSVKRNYDFNPGFGGPIMKDKLWFYASSRENASGNYAAGAFANLNANNPALWKYVPDPNNKGYNDTTSKGYDVRLTWQASARNKLGLSVVRQFNCQCPQTVAATTSPEAASRGDQNPQTKIVLDYTSPITSRLLFEAGVVRQRGVSNTLPMDGFNDAMISVQEQTSPAGLRYRAASQYRYNYNLSWHARSAISYVTGSHAIKTGYNLNWGQNTTTPFSPQPLNYRFSNGQPNQFTMLALNFNDTHAAQGGIFVQDVWTHGRMTARYGLRFDMFTSSYPEQTLGPTPFTPNRNVVFPAKGNIINYKDITPRLGFSYDVFGDQKTAIKATMNKYVASMAAGMDLVANPNPALAVTTTATRNWTDSNTNFKIDCDILNPATQNLSASGGDICGALSDPNFGNPKPSATYDSDLMHGWNRRNYNWEFSIGVQRQLMSRVSMDVSYYRRWFGNFTVTDNLTYAASDFDQFSIKAPVDPALPNGGGYTVTGLYDLNPSKFGQPSNLFVTTADNYGKQLQHWNGVDVLFNVRPTQGILLQGGTSTGRTMYDNCEVAAKVPESLQGTPVFFVANGTVWQPLSSCHVQTPFQTNMKLLGSYTVPKVGVQVSATYQSIPGPFIQANYVATNAVVQPSLGRVLSGNAQNITVDLVQPGSAYGERLNQLDMRFAKIFKFGSKRTTVSMDLFNAPNLSTVITENPNYAAYRQPTSILLARFAKFNVQFDF